MVIGINHKIFRPAIIISTMLFLLTNSFIGCAGGVQHATLSRTSGQVLLQKSGTSVWVNVSDGTTLRQGDRIRTQTDSSAVIIFFDGSAISLSPDTEIRLEKMEREAGSTTIKLWEQIGASSSRIIKLVDPGSRYEIETPAGSALVRGSVMGVMVLNNGTTVVDAISDQCWAVAQGVEVLLVEGTRSIIYVGRPPTTPAKTTTMTIPPSNPSQAPAFFSKEPFEEKRNILPPGAGTRNLIPPEVSTDDWTGNLDPYLRLNGTLKSMGTASQVQVSFEFGTSPGLYSSQSSPQIMAATGHFYFDLDARPYYRPPYSLYYRAKADGGINGISYGAEISWVMPPPN